MSYADKVMDEISNETTPAQTEAPVAEEKPVETPAEPAPEQTEPAPEPEKEPEQTEESPKEEHKNFADERSEFTETRSEFTEPKPKKDTSQFSKEEKAEFAFQRQLSKQKAKYEQGLEEIKQSFKKDIDELKQSIAPKPEKKTRADFDPTTQGDDDYIRYLADEKVNEIMSERDAEAAKKAEQDKAEAEAREMQQQLARTFTDNAHKCFDETQYKAFDDKVKLATNNGLAEVLDEAPNVRDFLFTSPDGPLVLNEMLSSKEAFLQIMSRASNPIESTIELHEMAKSIRSRESVANQSAPAPAQPKPMPNIGKPGSTRGPAAPTMWDSDKALIDFVRRNR